MSSLEASASASASASTQLVTKVNYLAQTPDEIMPIIVSFLGFEAKDMNSLAKTFHLMHKLNLLPNDEYLDWYSRYVDILPALKDGDSH